MLSNNPIGFVNQGLYCVHDENLYLDRNISLAIPWDKNFYSISSYFFFNSREKVLNYLKHILRRKSLNNIHSFLGKLTISRGKNCCIFESKIVEQSLSYQQK